MLHICTESDMLKSHEHFTLRRESLICVGKDEIGVSGVFTLIECSGLICCGNRVGAALPDSSLTHACLISKGWHDEAWQVHMAGTKPPPLAAKTECTVPGRKSCPHIFLPQSRETGLQPWPHIISCCL